MCQLLKLENLKEIRIKKGLSQADLANLVSKIIGFDVHTSTISKWENLKSKPTPSYHKAITEILLYKEDSSIFVSTLRDNLGIDDTRSLTGIWSTIWSFEHNGETEKNPNILEIVHQGDIIQGISNSNNHSYQIVGLLLNDGIITGNWFSSLDRSKHHGTFLMNLSKSGKIAIGKWIGTYENDKLHEEFKIGDWEWRKTKNTMPNKKYSAFGK